MAISLMRVEILSGETNDLIKWVLRIVGWLLTWLGMQMMVGPLTVFPDIVRSLQLIRHIGAEGLNRRGPAGSCRLFLGPGFRLGARWNRLVETVKTRKKREKTGKKWARYSLKRVKVGS